MYPFKGIYGITRYFEKNHKQEKSNFSSVCKKCSVRERKRKEEGNKNGMEKKCELRECWVSCCMNEYTWLPVGTLELCIWG